MTHSLQNSQRRDFDRPNMIQEPLANQSPTGMGGATYYHMIHSDTEGRGVSIEQIVVNQADTGKVSTVGDTEVSRE